jgi:23S rRNA pseudouridine955/2504/2580 synthase/23S rRNA pseudouridine1911/1915/1917 synthase
MMNKLHTIYEDDCILAVNKPAGIATVRERSGSDGLAELLEQESGERVFIVHRLDKETSGIVLFAKEEAAHRNLSLQFQERAIAKTYLALVDGTLSEPEGRIDYPLSPAPKNKLTMHVNTKKGKESLTHFCVEKRFLNYTLLSVTPKTGRMHQVRVHCAAIGHPVVCDALYGSRNPLYLSGIKKDYRAKEGREEHPLLRRLALHALSLEFTHPRTGERMTLEAELPKDLRLTLRNLEKHSKVSSPL